MQKNIIIKCPRCQKTSRYSEDNIYRPFCSDLCKVQDIGAWAYEEYKIPGPYADVEHLPEELSEEENYH